MSYGKAIEETTLAHLEVPSGVVKCKWGGCGLEALTDRYCHCRGLRWRAVVARYSGKIQHCGQKLGGGFSSGILIDPEGPAGLLVIYQLLRRLRTHTRMSPSADPVIQ